MVNVYAKFAREVMALPVVVGHKSPGERFAGALDTLTIEAMMQDGKALQAGTSHFLGQNFAKSFDVQFTNKEGKLDYVWASSWGVSTRLMGALIMAHGDDNGLVLPPALAPIQVVMVPIYKSEEEHQAVLDKMYALKKALEAKGHSVEVDDRDTLRPGFKFAEWELKGVPVRLAMGPRDIQNGTVEVCRRDTLEKISEPRLSPSATLLSAKSTTGTSSRKKSRRADSCSAIGTALPRPKRRFRKRPRLRSAVSPWTAPSVSKRASASIPASHPTREYCLQDLINKREDCFK